MELFAFSFPDQIWTDGHSSVIGGDLFSYMDRKGTLNDGEAKYIFFQLFKALQVYFLADINEPISYFSSVPT